MPKSFQFLKWSGKKAVILLILTVALALGAVGGTLAFIVTYTHSLTNVFTPAKVDITVTGNQVSNSGDVPVYVRAAVVVNWVDEKGAIVANAPKVGENYDYTIDFNTAGGWFQASDGFWYYKNPLPAGDPAPKLINGVTQKNTTSSYTLSVEILSAGIQAAPTEAVEKAWLAVEVADDGVTLQKKTVANP